MELTATPLELAIIVNVLLCIGAAMIIPAFTPGYGRRQPEAERYLSKLASNARTYAIEHGHFPFGTSNTTPSCPFDERCRLAPSKWADDPVWRALDFESDEWLLFRYRYESFDGQHLRATAIAGRCEYSLECSIAENHTGCTLIKPSNCE